MARGKGDRSKEVPKREKFTSELQEDDLVRQERRPNPFFRSWAWKREHRSSPSRFLAFQCDMDCGMQ